MTPAESPSAPREPARALAVGLLLGLLVVVVLWVARRTTWYLSIDQFGYLTFAKDLSEGRMAHAWPFLPILEAFLPAGASVDILGQSYVYDEGGAYSRYAPGFPLLLALVQLGFGPGAVHGVNPVAAGLLLAVMFWLARRTLDSSWWALVVSLMVTLFPTYVLLWSLSPLRDVPAHTAAMTSLALLLPVAGRASGPARAAAGVALGFAISTRVDAVLYGIPVAGLLWLQGPWRARDLVGIFLGVLAGLTPLLAYNSIATGNPLWPTQAMELHEVFSMTGPLQGWLDRLHEWAAPVAHAAEEALSRARPPEEVQGGGIRLRHLGQTLPANLQTYASVFGSLGLVLAVLGAWEAWRSKRFLFAATVPYVLVATFFFSLWTRPDPRYLLGSILLLAVLIAAGMQSGVALAGRAAREWGTVGLVGVLAVVGAATWGPYGLGFEQPGARPWVVLVLGAGLATSALWSWVRPAVEPRWVGAAVGIALSIVVGVRAADGLSVRSSFQAPEVAEAQESFATSVGDDAVVITSAKIGRPAENINFYTDASAAYLEELLRWRLRPRRFLDLMTEAGLDAYLLLPPEEARRWTHSAFLFPWYEPVLVAEIPADRARAWFVASAGHAGLPLWLVRMEPRGRRVPMPDRPALTRTDASAGSR